MCLYDIPKGRIEHCSAHIYKQHNLDCIVNSWEGIWIKRTVRPLSTTDIQGYALQLRARFARAGSRRPTMADSFSDFGVPVTTYGSMWHRY